MSEKKLFIKFERVKNIGRIETEYKKIKKELAELQGEIERIREERGKINLEKITARRKQLETEYTNMIDGMDLFK
ncbi:hypothetical protein ECANGB1_1441 [Enterospora canceri]|uniref:Uncharacterized protein n=1 Tax=Enterospora canceri TaxID=1081671 RepID=A0A1Y1S630_9MICR|nr:hypothetical protein ECANGB1_1441 [Enterospora canceri]